MKKLSRLQKTILSMAKSAAVARSLTWLRNRGLMIRVEGYHVLTKEGHKKVSFWTP